MGIANLLTRGRARLGNGVFTIIKQHSVAVNPSNLIDAAGETITISTVTGAALGDFCLVAPGVDLVGVSVTAWVSAANEVKVRVQNETAGTVDLVSSTWNFLILRMG